AESRDYLRARRRRPSGWLWLAVPLLFASRAGAQTDVNDALRALQGPGSVTSPESAAVRETHARPSLAGPVDPEHYVLGPGDVLSLEYGGRAFDTKVFTVDSEGRVRVPNLGLVSVGGETLAAARQDIVRRLKPYVPGATLDLRLIQARIFKVFVMGE